MRTIRFYALNIYRAMTDSGFALISHNAVLSNHKLVLLNIRLKNQLIILKSAYFQEET